MKKIRLPINFSFFKKIFLDRKWSIITYSMIVAIYGVLMIAMFPSFKESNIDFEELFKAYPKAFIEAFGINVNSFTTIEGFLSGEYFSLMWIIILGILAFSLGSRIVAGEVDKGTSEFSFTLPLRRMKLVLSKFTASYVILLIIVFISLLSVGLGIHGINENPRVKGLIAMFLVGAVLSFFLLAFATAVSSLLGSKGKVYGVCGGFLLISYMLHIFNGISARAADFYFLSFFKYYGSPDKILLTAEITGKNIAVFLIAGIVLLIFSLIMAEKRDL